MLHQTTRLLRIQKWLPHRSFGTQIEGDKDARPLRNERFHLGIADGIRHTSIRSPQPQGQESIAHLYLLDFSHNVEMIAERKRQFAHRWDHLYPQIVLTLCDIGPHASKYIGNSHSCHSIPKNGCWSASPQRCRSPQKQSGLGKT